MRCREDLQIDGKYHPKFRELICNLKLTPCHEKLLKNAQDCYNSFNAGRPDDALERVTQTPRICLGSDCKEDDEILNDFNAHLEAQYVNNMDYLIEPDQIEFKDNCNQLLVSTSNVTMRGSHKCGRTLLQTPNVVQGSNAVMMPDKLSSDVDENFSEAEI